MHTDRYFQDGTCYVWLEFEFDGYDLYPTELNSLKEDHWLPHELSKYGWDLIIWPDWKSKGCIKDWTNWALKQGLSPCQPFLLKLDPPHFLACNHPLDPEEWDVEYTWEIVQVDQVDPTGYGWREVLSCLLEGSACP